MMSSIVIDFLKIQRDDTSYGENISNRTPKTKNTFLSLSSSLSISSRPFSDDGLVSILPAWLSSTSSLCNMSIDGTWMLKRRERQRWLKSEAKDRGETEVGMKPRKNLPCSI